MRFLKVFVFLNIIVVWLAYLASNSFLSAVRDQFPELFQAIGMMICLIIMIVIGKFTIGPVDKKLRHSGKESEEKVSSRTSVDPLMRER